MDLKVLKELRKQRKITSKDMARHCGVHRDTVNKLESGDDSVLFGTLVRYIDYLGDIELKLILKG